MGVSEIFRIFALENELGIMKTVNRKEALIKNLAFDLGGVVLALSYEKAIARFEKIGLRVPLDETLASRFRDDAPRSAGYS